MACLVSGLGDRTLHEALVAVHVAIAVVHLGAHHMITFPCVRTLVRRRDGVGVATEHLNDESNHNQSDADIDLHASVPSE